MKNNEEEKIWTEEDRCGCRSNSSYRRHTTYRHNRRSIRSMDKIIGPRLKCGHIFARFSMIPAMEQASQAIVEEDNEVLRNSDRYYRRTVIYSRTGGFSEQFKLAYDGWTHSSPMEEWLTLQNTGDEEEWMGGDLMSYARKAYEKDLL